MEAKISETLARFATSLSYEALPGEVVAKAKQCILDQLGVEVACSALPWTQMVYDYVKSAAGRGKSTILNYGLKTSPEYAAFANGAFGQSFEIDDVHLKGPTGHPGCTTVPTALAVGERQGIGGKDFLTAVVAGYEVMAAVAQGVQPTMLVERGFHPNGACGPFAAAAIAGRLLGLDQEQMVNALGIAGSHASGLMEYTQSGGDVKRLYGGLGAMGGIRSALLAQRGYTGPPTVLEGKKGFCRAFSNQPNPGAITRGLGKEFWTLDTGFKPYCCNGNIIPGVDAVLNILKQTPIRPREVEEIRVGTNRVGMVAVANIGPQPKSLLEAQFSMHFSLALTLVKGKNDFRTYIETNLADPKLVGLARKVKMELDEECDRDHIVEGKMSCRVGIRMKNGRTYQSFAYAKGTAENPMSQEELEDKFRGLAAMVLPPQQAEGVVEIVRNLERLGSLSRLARLLVRPKEAV